MTDREETLVYHFDRDLEQVLHNAVSVWNRNKDYKKRWNINPKEEIFVNMRSSGDFLELRVEGLRGGWRTSVVDQQEMNKFLAEMKDHLKKAESELRSEFKKACGKAFRWSKGKSWENFEPIAQNGVYRFVAYKSGPVSVKLDRQKHSEDGPGIDGGKVDKEDSWKLSDILSLPEHWR